MLNNLIRHSQVARIAVQISLKSSQDAGRALPGLLEAVNVRIMRALTRQWYAMALSDRASELHAEYVRATKIKDDGEKCQKDATMRQV